MGVRESIANAGMCDSLGIAHLSGKLRESGSILRLMGKSWNPGGEKVFIFLELARECSQEKERLTQSGVVPHGWI